MNAKLANSTPETDPAPADSRDIAAAPRQTQSHARTEEGSLPIDELIALPADLIAEEVVETAAGSESGSNGGGGSTYQDDMGDLIAGLTAQDVLGAQSPGTRPPASNRDDSAPGSASSPARAAIGEPGAEEPGTGESRGAGASGATGGTGDTGATGDSDDSGGAGDTDGAQGSDNGGTNSQGGQGGENAPGGQVNAGAGNGGEVAEGELSGDDVDPGNSGSNNNAPDLPPGLSEQGTVYTLSAGDLGGTIKGFDGDADTLDLSEVLSDLGIDEADRAAAVDILFGRGRDATVNLDADGDGSYERLAVVLDNYKGDLGLDDLQLIQADVA